MVTENKDKITTEEYNGVEIITTQHSFNGITTSRSEANETKIAEKKSVNTTEIIKTMIAEHGARN